MNMNYGAVHRTPENVAACLWVHWVALHLHNIAVAPLCVNGTKVIIVVAGPLDLKIHDGRVGVPITRVVTYGALNGLQELWICHPRARCCDDGWQDVLVKIVFVVFVLGGMYVLTRAVLAMEYFHYVGLGKSGCVPQTWTQYIYSSSDGHGRCLIVLVGCVVLRGLYPAYLDGL